MSESNTKSGAVYEGRDLEAMFFAQNYHRWIIEQFRPYIGKTTGEVGGGSGNFSELLLQTKLITELTIMEPSQDMYHRLQSNLTSQTGVHLLQAYLADVFRQYPDYFDTLFYVNVLEHVEDDEEEMRLIHSCLHSEGFLCLFVPALSWLYSDFDRDIGHFRRYHKASLGKKLEQNGFELVKLKYMDMTGIFGWYIFYRLFKKKMKAAEVKFYDTYFVPLIKPIEKFFPAPLGKNLLAVARKK